MGVKTKAIILAFTIAVITGLLLWGSWHSKTKQVTNNDTDKTSLQEHVHVLQDKSASEVQPGTQQPNQEPKSAQPDDAMKPEKAVDEYVLMSVTNWGFMVEYQVVINGAKERISIPLDNTIVQLRVDGKDITTIILGNKASRYSLADYESGIILVPNQEDVMIWQNWISKQNQKIKEFLAEQEEKKKGRRILPPTD